MTAGDRQRLPDSGDREGPLSACQTAALDYRARLGWQAFSATRAVWLRLPIDIAVINLSPAVAGLFLTAWGTDGPVIGHPDGRCVVLAHCNALWGPHSTEEDEVVHLGYRAQVDLPPTAAPGGPLVWLRPPEPDIPLPGCTEVLHAVRAIRDR